MARSSMFTPVKGVKIVLYCRLYPQNSAWTKPHRHTCITTSAYLEGKKSRSDQWINRMLNDPFFKRAKQENWRCRSAYKLIEIDERFNILKPGFNVIDCGAAPGSWTQVAVQKVCAFDNENGSTTRKSGKVISVDLQHIDPIKGAVIFDKSDITSPDTQSRILEELNGDLADVVLSDMAPNSSGIKSLDQDVIIELCLSVLKFCTVVLGDKGSVVCKIWTGADRQKLKSVMERMFKKVTYVKPDASRPESAELYLVGQEYFLRKT